MRMACSVELFLTLNWICPSLRHFNCFLPPCKHPGAVFPWYLGVKNGPIFAVDVLQFIELLPNADSETGCDCSSERRCFTHHGPIDRNTDNIGLCLHVQEKVSHIHQVRISQIVEANRAFSALQLQR